MAKKVFDRIFKTFIIVIDVIWGLIMSLYSIGILFADHYAVESAVSQVIMGTIVLVIVNCINVVIRRWIRSY